jgi:hypothetical protein
MFAFLLFIVNVFGVVMALAAVSHSQWHYNLFITLIVLNVILLPAYLISYARFSRKVLDGEASFLSVAAASKARSLGWPSSKLILFSVFMIWMYWITAGSIFDPLQRMECSVPNRPLVCDEWRFATDAEKKMILGKMKNKSDSIDKYPIKEWKSAYKELKNKEYEVTMAKTPAKWNSYTWPKGAVAP